MIYQTFLCYSYASLLRAGVNTIKICAVITPQIGGFFSVEILEAKMKYAVITPQIGGFFSFTTSQIAQLYAVITPQIGGFFSSQVPSTHKV